jgi:hypothetical protein
LKASTKVHKEAVSRNELMEVEKDVSFVHEECVPTRCILRISCCTVELNVVGDRQLIEIRFQWHLINKGEQQCLTWTESSQLHMQQGRAVS